jgi:hypothetical protein
MEEGEMRGVCLKHTQESREGILAEMRSGEGLKKRSRFGTVEA